MELKTLLTLTEKEEILRDDFIKNADNEKILFEIVIDLKDVTQLIKLACVNPVIDNLLQGKIFDLYWFGILKKYNSEEEFDFEELPTTHSLNLIKGNYLFCEYLKLKKNNLTDALMYLEQSSEYGFYPACSSMLKYCLEGLKREPNQLFTNINKIKHISTLITKINWTPGYTMASLTYLSLAINLKQNNLYPALPKKLFCKAFYLSDLAEILADYSKPMIHNVSRGRGLDAINERTGKNLKGHIQDKAWPLLTEADISNCLTKSRNQFNTIANLYNLAITTPIALTTSINS
jgi:hypothetical protein